jgi:hypothetical protein
MGLIIDGTWEVDGEEKVFDQQEISAKQMAELFELEDELFPKKAKPTSTVDFQFHRSKTQTVNGQKRTVKQLQVPTQFTANKNGNTVTLTYYKRKTKKRDPITNRMEEQLMPRKVLLDRKVTPLQRGKDADLIVYLALHNQCYTSPLAHMTNEKSWGYLNHTKEADEYMKNIMAQNTLRNEILTMPEVMLRIRAKGLKINAVDNMKEATIRATMVKMLEQAIARTNNRNFEQFKLEYESAFTGVAGRVQDCLDRGFIERHVITGGQFAFRWSNAIGNNDRICVVERNKSPKDFLFRYMTNHWTNYSEMIENALKFGSKINVKSIEEMDDRLKEEAKPAAQKSVSELSVEEVTTELINYGAVHFDFSKKAIFFVVGGKLDKKPITAASHDTWKKELEMKLGEDAELLKKSKQKINGKRIASQNK